MQICKHNDGKGRCAVFGEHCTDGPCDCEELVEYEPVRHGRWVDRYGNKYANHLYECSECKEKALYRFEVDGLVRETVVQDLSDFCPNCGAKMDAMTFEEVSRYLGKQAAETLDKLKEEGNAKG